MQLENIEMSNKMQSDKLNIKIENYDDMTGPSYRKDSIMGNINSNSHLIKMQYEDEMLHADISHSASHLNSQHQLRNNFQEN